ncbi:hypothetical protein ABE869_17535 [Enterococcus gilvus]|uniref:hypothetical protein n=1 Tax=Enterococcus gilvus TaxID=160453 RepID=UPI003D6AB763
MLFVVETIEDNEKKYSVVESESPKGAMLLDGFDLLQTEGNTPNKVESSITGIYEVAQTNHLLEMSRNAEVHRFYRERIKNLGFDSSTFKKLE